MDRADVAARAKRNRLRRIGKPRRQHRLLCDASAVHAILYGPAAALSLWTLLYGTLMAVGAARGRAVAGRTGRVGIALNAKVRAMMVTGASIIVLSAVCLLPRVRAERPVAATISAYNGL